MLPYLPLATTTTPAPPHRLVVIGAGPAGLTAAVEAQKRGFAVTVLEASNEVGGLAKTARRDGNGFDIGGHRFFTKFPQVEQWWHEVLPPEDFIHVRRQSRIYYRGKFFSYPLRAGNALAGLGPWTSLRVFGSYLWAKIHPRRPEVSFEDWVSNRFGRLLFAIFFETYTEKVWGIPCDQLSADWAAQRIKSLSLGKAIVSAFKPQQGRDVTTLIDEFQYPRRGPGMMWERAQQLVEARGGHVLLKHPVVRIAREAKAGFTITANVSGRPVSFTAEAVISTMPLQDLMLCLEPPPPPAVGAAARSLSYRDFLNVALVVNRTGLFPDNWIYIHDAAVRASRIQNYNNWSEGLVAEPGTTCLGVEYHCNQGDELWRTPDEQLIARASTELEHLKLARAGDVRRGWVIREPRAYPRYTGDYQRSVGIIAEYLANIPNFFTVGRAGMHKYNNQDHSMLTAMLAVDNLGGARHDLWAVNADDEYHEIKTAAATPPPPAN